MDSIRSQTVSLQKNLQQFEKQVTPKAARLAGKLFGAGSSNQIIQTRRSTYSVISDAMRKAEQVRGLFSKQTVSKLREQLSSKRQETKSSYTEESFLKNNEFYGKIADPKKKEFISGMLKGYVSTLNELIGQKEDPKTEEKARKEIESLGKLINRDDKEFGSTERAEALKEALREIQDALRKEFPEKSGTVQKPLPSAKTAYERESFLMREMNVRKPYYNLTGLEKQEVEKQEVDALLKKSGFQDHISELNELLAQKRKLKPEESDKEKKIKEEVQKQFNVIDSKINELENDASKEGQKISENNRDIVRKALGEMKEVLIKEFDLKEWVGKPKGEEKRKKLSDDIEEFEQLSDDISLKELLDEMRSKEHALDDIEKPEELSDDISLEELLDEIKRSGPKRDLT